MNINARRVYANLIDGLISIGFFFLGIAVSSDSIPYSALFFRFLFAVGFAYFFFKDVFDGAGIGKRILGIRVQHSNGEVVGVAWSFYRNLIFMLPVVGFLDILIGYFSQSSQRKADQYIDAQVIISPSPTWTITIAKKVSLILLFSFIAVAVLQGFSKLEKDEGPRDTFYYSTHYSTMPAKDRIYAASEHGDIDELNRLFKEGVDPNALNSNGSVPLEYAALSGSYEAVELLLKSGAKACELTNVTEHGGEHVLTILKRVTENTNADVTKRDGRLKVIKRLESIECK